MGYKLYREVKLWAPATLTHREKLTAMILADDANDATRLTYSSVVDAEIMRQAMVPDERSMRRIIAKLKDEKVLEHVSGGHNGRTAKYRFLHIAPAGDAAEEPGDSDPATGDVGGSKTPGYEEGPEAKGGQKDPATEGVGGSFCASSRVKKTRPTPSPPTTSSSNTDTRSRSAVADSATTGPGFDDWYRRYPNKGNRKAATKAWDTAIKKPGVTFEQLDAALSEHISLWTAERREKRYIPHASTWLNGERWDDELNETIPMPNPGTRGRHSAYTPDDTDDAAHVKGFGRARALDNR